MEKMTNEKLYELKNVSQPLSIGDVVFYLETSMNKEENSYETMLWAFNKQTNARVRFGTDSKKYALLRITPNKKSLSFLSLDDKTEKMQVFVQPLSGGSAKRLTSEEEGVSIYFWTQDGELIYQTVQPKEKKEKDEKSWPTATQNKKIVYKLDGASFLKENQTVVIKKTDIQKNITDTLLTTNEDYNLIEIAESANILYLSGPKNPEDEWEYGSRLYFYDVSVKEITPLTNEMPEAIFFNLSISPDGKEKLLIGNDFSYNFVTLNEIYWLNHDQKLQPLTVDLDADLGDSIVGDFQQNLSSDVIQWQDDKQFLFSTTEQGTIKLYRSDLNGNIEVAFDKKAHITDWNLDSLEEKIYISYSTPTIPSRLAVFDLETNEWKDLYDPNEEVLSQVFLSKHESFTYKGARDWNIHGWYVAPQDNLENHPAVLYIHGGPQVSYGETFFHEMQALSGAGYGVILLNPRGGSGYGQSFVASILGDYGNEDYQDLMLGLDAVLENHPEINKEQLFVAGGSYGGFMTNWIVTHTDRFRAAVTQRSISNWISFYGASDVGPFFVELQLLHDLSEVEKLWAMSPLAYEKNLKTPLLVIHSHNDLRCPMDQGEQMYRAALKQSVESELITFPESSHGLSREGLPNLRQERLEAVVNWFNTHK